MRGEPRVARLLDRTTFGRRAPRELVRVTDLAGIVDAVGDGVTRWRVGDPVFGRSPRQGTWPSVSPSAGQEIWGSALQLVANLSGMAVAGWLTLAVQEVVSARMSARRNRVLRRLRGDESDVPERFQPPMAG